MSEKNLEELKSLQNSPKKKKKINHSDLGPDFVAPDGGFGWMVCVAAGLSNVRIFEMLNEFEIV